MSGAEIAGIVLGAIGPAVAGDREDGLVDIATIVLSVLAVLGFTVSALYRELRGKYHEWKRWQCLFGGQYREYSIVASEFTLNPDEKTFSAKLIDPNSWQQSWLGDWVECSQHCSAARSGVCVQSTIATFGHVETLHRLRAYRWRAGAPLRQMLQANAEFIATNDSHPITGEQAPTFKTLVWMKDGELPVRHRLRLDPGVDEAPASTDSEGERPDASPPE